MENLKRRGLSFLLALVMIVSMFAGVRLPEASAAGSVNYVTGSNGWIYNWGECGTTATILSPMAEDWYTAQDTSYSELYALSGSSTLSSVPSSALYQELQDLMTNACTSTGLGYDYDDTRDMYQYTDCENNNTTQLKLLYLGDTVNSTWDSGTSYNREHCWPKSKSLNGDTTSETADEADIMLLRATNSNENSRRGNYAYGESQGYYDPLYGLIGSDSASSTPRSHNVRGDVARIVLYVYVRWGNTANMWSSNSDPDVGVIESLDILLTWMEEDPVDTWEMGRNDSVESIMGTRNVFVDYPELAFKLFDADVPENYATPSGSVATSEYEITATSNNNSYGTVSTNGVNINAAPADGYYAAGYTLISGTASVTQNGNVFTVDASTDCTVQINFAARETATVTFKENGATGSTKSAYLGDSITLPGHTTSILEGYTFVGWVENTVDEETDSKPATIHSANASYTVNSDTILYALYSRTTESGSSGSGNYVKVTSDPGNWAGEYLIVYEDESFIFDGSLSTLDATENYQAVDISDNTITSAQGDDYKFIIATVDGGYSIQSASGYYIGQNSNANGMVSSTDADASDTNTITWNTDGTVNIIGSGNAYLRFNTNSGQDRFRYFKSSTYSSQKAICLYVKEGTAGTTYYTTSTCDHSSTTSSTVNATCTTDGSTTVTCNTCETVISTTVLTSPGHSYNANGVCTVCGAGEPVQVVIYTPNLSPMMALSSSASENNENYNGGVEVTIAENVLSGYDDTTDIWTLVDNGNNTYSILMGDQYLCLSNDYTSMSLCDPTDETVTHHHTWEIIPVGENLYNIRNTTRTNEDGDTGYCIEWYSSASYFNAYKTDKPYSNSNYQLTFYVVSGTLPTFTCTHNYVVTTQRKAECLPYTEEKLCSKCGDEQTTDYPASAEHNWVAGTVTPPTAVDQGYTTYSCPVCGSTKKDDYTDPVAGTDGCTVTFVVPAGVNAIAPMVSTTEGITLPTPGIPSADYEYTFAGWATSTINNSTTVPTLYTGNYAPTTDVTLYAVYTYAPVNNVFTLVESTEDLVIGNEIVITANDLSAYPYAMGAQKNNNRGAGSVTVVSDTTITIGEDVQVFVLYGGTVANTYAFKSDDGYLYAAGSSSNYLKSEASIGTNSSWTITIDTTTFAASVVATASSNRNVMRFNYNNGSPLFACYASASQQALSLYTKSATVLTYTTEITRTESYDVTFSTPEGVASIPDTICGKTGITLPTAGVPYNTLGYAFVGWSTTTYGKATSKPTMYYPGEVYYATANTTFYAVYTYSTTDSGSSDDELYVLKDIADIVPADSVVITMTKDGTTYALPNDGGASSPTAVIVAPSNDTLTNPATTLKWNIGGTAGNYVLYPENNHDIHLYCTNSNTGVRIGSTDGTFAIQNSYLYNNEQERYLGVYNSKDWRSYTTINSNITGQELGFYVKSSGATYYTTEVEVAEPPVLEFSAASLEVSEGISINFKVSVDLFTESLYDLESAAAAFVFDKGTDNERSFTTSNYKLSTDGKYYVFQLYNIRPDWMGDTVSATLTAKLGDTETTSAVKEYSVATYCYNKLNDADSSDELKKLVIDMLNYGAATQLHTGYKTDALVNADLTDAQKAWTAPTDLDDSPSFDGTAVTAPTASFKGASLFLRETVRIRLRFTVDDTVNIEDVIVKATVGTNDPIELTKFEAAGTGYYVFFDALLTYQMREPIQFTVYNGDTAISKTLTYSVEAYVVSANKSNENFANMLYAMMNYGDAVAAYAN